MAPLVEYETFSANKSLCDCDIKDTGILEKMLLAFVKPEYIKEERDSGNLVIGIVTKVKKFGGKTYFVDGWVCLALKDKDGYKNGRDKR